MKKIVLVLALVLGVSVNAQEGFKAGLNFGAPIGDAGDFASFSLGIDVAYMFEVSDNFDAGIASGFTNGFTDDISILGATIEVDDVQFLPIAAAGRFKMADKFSIGGDIGYAIGINDGNEGGFYYRPTFGYNLTDKIETTLSYTGISRDGGSWDTINLGIGYRFL